MSGPFPVSGAIDARGFPFLVMDLYHHAATGSLKVDGPSYQKDLYFRGGRVLFGSSNDPRDQLGAILIEAGKLTPEQLEEVNSKVGPGNPLAKVLADSGLVTQQELTEAARLKVEQILGDILTYQEGSFEFEDGVLPKGAVDLKLNTDRLVLGAVRRVSDRSFVLGHLGSLEVVLKPTGEPSAEARAAAGVLLSEIDGARTLKEAVGRTKLDEFEGAKIACGLLFLGLFERPTPQATATPSAAVEDSPFFVSEPPDTGLDLSATARDAIGELAPEPPARRTATPLPAEPPPAPEPARLAMAPEPPAVLETPASEPTPGFQLPPLPPLPPSLSSAPAPSPPVVAPPPLPPIGAEAIEEERPLFPRIDPPNSRDMAALNTLLSAPRQEPPLRRPSAPGRSAPRFVPQPSQDRLASPGPTSRAWLWISILVILGAGAGVAGWWYVAGPGSRVVAQPPRAQNTPPLAPPTLATPALTPPTAPSTAPTELPQPVETPLAEPPATAAPTVNPVAGADARALLRARRFHDAGRAFLADTQPLRERHTVQILVACSDETLDKTLEAVGSEQWFIVPVDWKGRSCHRLCWGIYASAAAAEDAARRLPDYFRSGGARPRAVTVASILP